MPTRPSITVLPSSSSSQSVQHRHQAVIHELYPLFAGLTFHLITAKLKDVDVGRIYQCIDDLGGRCVGVEEAKIVITAIKGRPRLLRVLDRIWLDTKPILGIEYVDDTFQLCLDYANSSGNSSGNGTVNGNGLSTETEAPHLPKRDKYQISLAPPAPHRPTVPRFISTDDEHDDEDDQSLRPSVKRRKLDEYDGSTLLQAPKEEEELGDMKLLDEDVRLEDIPPLCVHRGSPLVCVNQDIINAIKPIFEEREYEEAQQKNSNVLSYRRSLSILKAVPRRIRSGKEAMKLLGVGEKVAQRIDEYLQTGSVAESESILCSSRFQALNLFASVYTIGHHKAKELYDKHYCRTLEDVRMHFEAVEEESPEVRMKDKLRRRRRGGMKQVEIVEEWIKLKDELDSKIPREEVQEIADCVMEHLDAFIPGCDYTICGGYRRGKPASNDVDIVFAPPKDGQDIGLLKDLYLRLSQLGIITHVLHVTHRSEDVPIHATPQNFDNLDKAFVILKLPGKGRLHHRVDLISAPRDRYASAVLSWSGSMMFERDLKRYAENERGYKFRAGLIKISTGEEFNLPTERDIFQFLGLRYVPPELRNADG